jgi:cystathionine beta-lyase/cystathionine gamma-synthase
VIHSATKYLGGHNDLLAGAVLGNAGLISAIRDLQGITGAVADPFAAYLLIRGIKTLALRVARQNENAERVAEFLAAHPKVREVHYPGLPDHPQHELARRQMRGFTGMVAFDVGSLDAARRVLEGVRLFALAESLGGVESLVSHPATMTHASLPPERRAMLGITDSLLRISAGVEDVEDLKADLEQALEQA